MRLILPILNHERNINKIGNSHITLVGSYTNIIGNGLVLVGVALSVWQRMHTTEPPPITSSGITVPVDTGSLRQAELHTEQQ